MSIFPNILKHDEYAVLKELIWKKNVYLLVHSHLANYFTLENFSSYKVMLHEKIHTLTWRLWDQALIEKTSLNKKNHFWCSVNFYYKMK